MGGGIVGFEIEGTYTPDFFGDTPGDNNVTTLMGNLLLGVPIGDSARIYATGGAGLMKFRVQDVDEFFDIDRNDFGINVGRRRDRVFRREHRSARRHPLLP